MKVEGVVADAPGHCAVFRGRRLLIRLALDAQVHDVSATDCAVLNFDVPGPHSHCVPLLHFELPLHLHIVDGWQERPQ